MHHVLCILQTRAAALGSKQHTTGCLCRMPMPQAAMAAMAARMSQTETLKIGIHIRVGDGVFKGGAKDPSLQDYQHFFDCAQVRGSVAAISCLTAQPLGSAACWGAVASFRCNGDDCRRVPNTAPDLAAQPALPAPCCHCLPSATCSKSRMSGVRQRSLSYGT